jgi:hypothetical protein
VQPPEGLGPQGQGHLVDPADLNELAPDMPAVLRRVKCSKIQAVSRITLSRSLPLLSPRSQDIEAVLGPGLYVMASVCRSDVVAQGRAAGDIVVRGAAAAGADTLAANDMGLGKSTATAPRVTMISRRSTGCNTLKNARVAGKFYQCIILDVLVSSVKQGCVVMLNTMS